MSDKVTQADKDLAEELGMTVQPDPITNDHPSAHDLVFLDIASRPPFSIPRYATKQQAYDTLLGIYLFLKGGERLAGMDAIELRKEYGLRKYDTLLQPFNGRNHSEDALEEFEDLLVYLRADLYEKENQ